MGVFKRKTSTLRWLVAKKLATQIIGDWALLLSALLTSTLWLLTATAVGLLAYVGASALLSLVVVEEIPRISIAAVVTAVMLYWGRKEFFRVWGQDDGMEPPSRTK